MPEQRATTMEEYLVERIYKLEDINESQRDTIQSLQDEISGLHGVLNRIRNRVKLNIASDGDSYVEFNNAWKRYDKEEFNFFVKLFGLEDGDEDGVKDE